MFPQNQYFQEDTEIFGQLQNNMDPSLCILGNKEGTYTLMNNL